MKKFAKRSQLGATAAAAPPRGSPYPSSSWRLCEKSNKSGAILTPMPRIFAAIFALALPAFSQTPEYKTLRDAQLSESFTVDNVTLHRDAGMLTLKSGTISFAPAVL